MNMEERLQAVVSQAETDGTKWHTIIHGDNATTVSTENGNVPSVAKQMADVRNELINGVADYLGSCQSARDTTLQAKTDTLTIKSQTETLKSQTQVLRNEVENFKNLSQSTFNNISSTVSSGISTIQNESLSQQTLIQSAGSTEINNINSAGNTQIALATAQADRAESYALNMSVRFQSLYQDLVTVSNNIVNLQDEVVVYQKNISTETSLTFSTSNLTKNDKIITFELLIEIVSGGSIIFPSNLYWLNGEIPEIAEIKKYLFAFRSFDNGLTWLGNLQGGWL